MKTIINKIFTFIMFSQSPEQSPNSWKTQLEHNPLFSTLLNKGFTRNQIFSMVEERCKHRSSALTSNQQQTIPNPPHVSPASSSFISNQYSNEFNMRKDMTREKEIDIISKRFENESTMRKDSHQSHQYGRDTTAERFANESNLRRENHRPHQQTMLATPVQFQDVPHKSNMEDTFQNAFQERQAATHITSVVPPPPPSRTHLIPVSSKTRLAVNVNEFEAMERQKHEAELERRREYEKQTRIRRDNYQREINRLKNNMNES